jgi:hypothetical protein
MMEDDKVEVKNQKADVEVQEPATGHLSDSGVHVGVGKYKVHVSDKQLPHVGVFFAATVLLIAACVSAQGLKYYKYSISVAAVAMFFSALGFGLTFNDELNEQVGKFNSYFLVLWCFIGACILTFSSPFTSTDNGYFASWGTVIFSLMGVQISVGDIKDAVEGMGSLLGLGASSIVVIVAASTNLDSYWKNETIYALTVACVTVIVVAVFARDMVAPPLKFVVLAVFSLLWIVLACLVTFRGPFFITGNGYFGSWGGAITSVFAAMSALKE